MCNLYGHTSTQEAMARLFKPNAVLDRLGNYEPQPEIYPDQLAPIVRVEGDQIILHRARWGLPTPETYLEGHAVDRGVTNIRNTDSPHWRRWLGTANRCLVPLSSFAEPAGKGRGNAWFRLADARPAMFAGLYVPGWTSVRKKADGETTDNLFAFLTCEPNETVAQIHPKAMPVILTERAEWRTWLRGDWAEAKALQRPLADDLLLIEVE